VPASGVAEPYMSARAQGPRAMANAAARLQTLVDEAASEVRRLRRAEHCARQATYRSSRPLFQKLSLAAKVAAGLIFCICGDQRTVEVYVTMQCRRQGLCREAQDPSQVRAAVAVLLADGSIRLLVEEAWCHRRTRRTVFRAASHVAEIRLLRWLMQQNLRGAVVSTGHLLMQFRRCWPATCSDRHSFVLLLRLRHRPTFQSSWVRRFRQRWHVQWRRLSHCLDLSPQQVQERAGAPDHKPVNVLCLLRRLGDHPLSGSCRARTFRTIICSPIFRSRCEKWGPTSGPAFGTPFWAPPSESA